MSTRFRRMDESTAEQWDRIAHESVDAWAPQRLLGLLRSLRSIAALCHDIGKANSEPNHPAVAADLLQPFVRDEVSWMVRVPQDFEGRYYYRYLGKDPDAREQHRDHPSYTSPSASPTSGTRRRSNPTTRLCRSNTSSHSCTGSSPLPNASDRGPRQPGHRAFARTGMGR